MSPDEGDGDTSDNNHHDIYCSVDAVRGESGTTTMRLNKSSIRILDLISAMSWAIAVILLLADTLLFAYLGVEQHFRDIAKVWTTSMFAVAIGTSIWSAASWVVRQFEDSLHIAENVTSINSELARMRDRRDRREQFQEGLTQGRR